MQSYFKLNFYILCQTQIYILCQLYSYFASDLHFTSIYVFCQNFILRSKGLVINYGAKGGGGGGGVGVMTSPYNRVPIHYIGNHKSPKCLITIGDITKQAQRPSVAFAGKC